MKLINFISISALLLATSTSCSSIVTGMIKSQELTQELSSSAVPENRYDNLTYGIELNVSSEVSNENIVDNSELTGKTKKLQEKFTLNLIPSIREFVSESMSTYIRSMGIPMGQTESSYTLNVKVKEFKLVRGETSGRATVILDYELSNTNNEVIIRQTARGRYTTAGNVVDAIDKAYTKALADIDWNNIANALRINKRADLEPNKKVTGEGDTALEHQVINWSIYSSPQGADVYWRVVSNTSDVKNTNQKYLGTTNYEGTETFNVKGLNHTNSGNIQIEITIEKPGYIMQKRRFNLRQLIEQPEVSTKFNLVKEDE